MKTKQDSDNYIQEHYFPNTSPELEQSKVAYEETGKELRDAYQELKQAIEECIESEEITK